MHPFLRMFSTKHFFFSYLLILISLISFMEFYQYLLNTRHWLEPKCHNEQECTRILLVADPQLIGERNEMIHFLTPLSISDDDYYIKKTYRLAYEFVKPEVVIFLGDLLDEGSTATDEEFDRYVERFFNIFKEEDPSVKHIWLPGDNDIGGEWLSDEVTEEKVVRFEKAFKQPEMIFHKNIKFFKINRLTQNFTLVDKERDYHDISMIYVALSHLPIVDEPYPFVEEVLDKMPPHVVFTGHRHKAIILNTHALLRRRVGLIPVSQDDKEFYEYTLGANEMYEFVIPTCSYRMNTEKIGYGFAIIEKDKIRYTVLWSPSRFRQIFVYLTLMAYFIVLCVYLFYCRKPKKVRSKNF